MLTIYEKESLYESVDALYSEIKAYVEGAVGREELHEVELTVFRRVLMLGRGLLEAFVELSGTGYEAGNPPLSEAGDPMAYPTSFMLASAMNPCPCGHFSDPHYECVCLPPMIHAHRIVGDIDLFSP